MVNGLTGQGDNPDLSHLDRGLLDAAAEAQDLATLRRVLHHLWVHRALGSTPGITAPTPEPGPSAGHPACKSLAAEEAKGIQAEATS